MQPFHPTIEDVYDANVATDRGTVDVVRFFDTEGIEPKNSDSFSEKLPRHLFGVADGVVIVYSIDDDASFQIAEALKKEAEKYKEKKEVRWIFSFSFDLDLTQASCPRACAIKQDNLQIKLN